LKAIILSAGQGRRLLPLTEFRPKCLLSVSGRSVLDWQVQALAASGVREIVVVTGFVSEAVEAAAARLNSGSVRVRTLLNPFYSVADNIGSCYVARPEMNGDFLLLNGDTLIEPAILQSLLRQATAPVTVTTDRKPCYDEDDMKVSLDGRWLTAIGKKLPLEQTDAESIGLLLLRGEGGALFARGVESVLREPEGLKRYYLSAIDRLAETKQVGIVDIAGKRWREIDFPQDLALAEELTAIWAQQDWISGKAEPLAASQ